MIPLSIFAAKLPISSNVLTAKRVRPARRVARKVILAKKRKSVATAVKKKPVTRRRGNALHASQKVKIAQARRMFVVRANARITNARNTPTLDHHHHYFLSSSTNLAWFTTYYLGWVEKREREGVCKVWMWMMWAPPFICV